MRTLMDLAAKLQRPSESAMNPYVGIQERRVPFEEVPIKNCFPCLALFPKP